MLDTKRILVPEEILEIFFGNDYKGSLEIVSVAKSGSSGPKVVILRNSQKLYALKYGQTRVPISVQIRNRESLSLYLDHHRLPKVENYCSYPGGEAMLMEAVDGPNLHEAVMLGFLPDQDVIKLIEEILYEFSEVWYKTKSTKMELTRHPIERINRIIDLVYIELNNLQIGKDDRLVVNGIDLGSPYELVLLLKGYSMPKFSVFCHSDLNADNFVIKDGDWTIVDWEWVGLHDWKLSLSHLFGWWSSNATRLKKRPTLERVDSSLLLDYELVLSDIVKPIQERCISYGNKVAEYMGELDSWRYQFSILFATLLLGDLRFLKNRGRGEYSLPLLGEGLTAIKKIKEMII